MFKNLKIYTAISLVIGSFAFALLVTSAYSIYNSTSNNKNFNRILVAGENNIQLRDAAYNINSALARINALMLERNLGHVVTPEMFDNTRNILDMARKEMREFMSTPFNSQEGKAAAENASVAFENLYKITAAKLDAFNNPEAGFPGIDDELAHRKLVRESIEAFSSVTGKNNGLFVEEAERDYRAMIVFGSAVFILGLVMLFAVRYWLRQTLVKRLNETTASLKTIANGDLSRPVAVGAENEIGVMLKELEQMRVALTATVSGISGGVMTIHKNAREISSGNSDLSSRTEQQASALQETAASMEEIKTTVRQNADNAHTARGLAESASTNAREGGEQMQCLEQIMQQITVSSHQIAEINGVIDSIANQTNILALNAAVEAARAGEQGRGFAVVAEEVRSLAKRSAEAAKEINQLINTCVTTMESGSRQVLQTSAVMHGIVSSVSQVTEIMGEIASASDEQSAGINQISQAVNEMDLVTQQNAAMVEEAAAAASELERQSDVLENLVAKFVLDESAKIAAKPGVVGRTARHWASAKATADNDEWQTF
jgi:methyl-accepting chemotaxis protein